MPQIATAALRPNDSPVRVMVVDDSVVVRGLLSRWLGEDGLEVVGASRNGREALDALGRVEPDVVVLDIEMPEMDGLTALPLILEKRPGVQVIMASTLTQRNAELSLRALSLGASDYVPKPEGGGRVSASADFRREIVEKARQLGLQARRRRAACPEAAASRAQASRPEPVALIARAARAPRTSQTTAPPPVAMVARPIHGAATPVPASTARPAEPAAPAGHRLRPFSAVPPHVIAIGSSTGGPQALAEILRAIGPHIRSVPVLITQHMPPTFTAILAQHLAKAAGRPAREACDGEPVTPGLVLVAPGGRHMLLKRRGGQVAISLDDGPPVHFCKPAVDPMFATAAEVYGGACLGVVLTGMGHDGAQGAAAIAAAGGSIIAQDEATSVVWGMPGATVQAGVCSAVLPIGRIAPTIVELIRRGCT